MFKNLKQKLGVLLVLSMVTLLFPALTPPVEAATVTLFTDDFESGTVNWTAVNGAWSTTTDGSTVYRQSNSSGLATAGDSSWTDYSISARAKFTGTSSSAEAVIVGRVVSNSQFYQLHIAPSGWAIYKNSNNTWTNLASGPGSFSANQFYFLKLEFLGNRITAFINGTQMASVEDTSSSPHSSGKIGLRSYNSSANFDDVMVQADDGNNALFEEDFENGTSNWTVVSGSWSTTSDGSTVYRQSNSSGLATAGDSLWTDYSITARAKFTGTSSSAEAVIVGRVVSNTQFYQLHISPSGWAIFKNSNNSWTSLASGTGTFSANQFYSLKLEFIGNQIKAFIDGTEVASVEDTSSTSFSSGKIGLRTYQSSANFDDVVVSEIVENPPVTCDKTIASTTDWKFLGGSGTGSSYLNAQPGDTICIEAGVRPAALWLENFHGTEANPITFINYGGKVTINNTSSNYAMRVYNSSHFRITGTGDSAYDYGFKLSTTIESALDISQRSTNYEVDHLEVSSDAFAGMLLKTETSCNTNTQQGYFYQYNTRIHDNYIHNTHGEGMYLGKSNYLAGKQLTCDGVTVTVYPHTLEGVRVYNNIVEDTGWDGIQIGSATHDVKVYNNIVKRFGQGGKTYQDKGIEINPGTRGQFYNNYIADGTGAGIHNQGLAGVKIFNNVIVDVGMDGIYSHDKLRTSDSNNSLEGMHFWNNTIVNPGYNGIQVRNEDTGTNSIKNNLIVDTNQTGGYTYIYINPNYSGTWDTSHNLTYSQMSSPSFVDPTVDNYRLQSGSPAIDAGTDLTSVGVTFDHDGAVRPQGSGFDVGAFEY